MGGMAVAARVAAPVLPALSVERDEEALVHVSARGAGVEIRCTRDGSDPTGTSPLYAGPFAFSDGGTVKARAFAPGWIESPVAVREFGLCMRRTAWKVVFADSEHPGEGAAVHAIDGDPATYWHTRWGAGEEAHPHELQVDLGESYELTGFTCLPRQGQANGRIRDFAFYVSDDAGNWGEPVASGRFDNSAQTQTVLFEKAIESRYIRIVAVSEVNGNAWTSVAEIDVMAVRRVGGGR